MRRPSKSVLLLRARIGDDVRRRIDLPKVVFGFVAWAVAICCVIGFLEPFYVAAGFAMYLNRRAELEGWDVEQELRRAFGT